MAEEQIARAIAAPCIPISYGTIAFQIGKNKVGSAQEHSHKWMVFVRGASNQDISYAISKVVFTLHPSFDEPVRGELEVVVGTSGSGSGSGSVC